MKIHFEMGFWGVIGLTIIVAVLMVMVFFGPQPLNTEGAALSLVVSPDVVYSACYAHDHNQDFIVVTVAPSQSYDVWVVNRATQSVTRVSQAEGAIGQTELISKQNNFLSIVSDFPEADATIRVINLDNNHLLAEFVISEPFPTPWVAVMNETEFFWVVPVEQPIVYYASRAWGPVRTNQVSSSERLSRNLPTEEIRQEAQAAMGSRCESWPNQVMGS